jgi:hypothetical protein
MGKVEIFVHLCWSYGSAVRSLLGWLTPCVKAA